jgi:HK97 family phage prohead protease
MRFANWKTCHRRLIVNRPKTGELEQRTAPDTTVEGKRLRGVIPYNVESRDLGGWREVITPGALKAANLDDLVATVDHVGIPIGRYPTTLDLEDREDGAHWAVNLPESRSDVREAVERGDLRAGSWRMRVERDRWEGDVRYVEAIAELRDVSVVTAPAYPTAVTEFRSTNPGDAQEDTMGTQPEQDQTATVVENTEDRAVPSAGGLQVDDRAAITAKPRRGLMEEFRAAGFPGESATVPFNSLFEDRAITWSGSVDNIQSRPSQAGALGYDARYIWQVFPRVTVDAGVTSVDVVTQTARTLASAANTVRAIEAVTNKPETASTITVNAASMKQVATVQSGIPNVFLESPAISSIVEQDLRLAVSDGLDSLVVAAFAASGFQAPGTDNPLVSYRKAITTLRAAGYAPDTLVLTPAADEALDVMVSGITGGSADFVFAPGQFSSSTFFGMTRIVSKTVAAPVVVDSTAFGKFYASPVSLARFEENAGKTNTSLVRLECHALFGVERQAAAVRIAAS